MLTLKLINQSQPLQTQDEVEALKIFSDSYREDVLNSQERRLVHSICCVTFAGD